MKMIKKLKGSENKKKGNFGKRTTRRTFSTRRVE